MSKQEDSPTGEERVAFARLERAVGRLLERLQVTAERAEAAEARNVELTALVQRFTGDEAEAGALVGKLKSLEAENADLRDRLDRGREGVDRMLARIRFLENQT